MYSIAHILVALSTVFITRSVTADYKVYETTNRSEAHLFVYKTDSRFRAEQDETMWRFTDKMWEANFTVRWVKNRSEADLIIYWTNSLHEVGWKKKHKLQGKLNLK